MSSPFNLSAAQWAILRYLKAYTGTVPAPLAIKLATEAGGARTDLMELRGEKNLVDFGHSPAGPVITGKAPSNLDQVWVLLTSEGQTAARVVVQAMSVLERLAATANGILTVPRLIRAAEVEAPFVIRMAEERMVELWRARADGAEPDLIQPHMMAQAARSGGARLAPYEASLTRIGRDRYNQTAKA